MHIIYIHKYIHTYIKNTYIQTYIHTYLFTYIYTNIHTYFMYIYIGNITIDSGLGRQYTLGWMESQQFEVGYTSLQYSQTAGSANRFHRTKAEYQVQHLLQSSSTLTS